MSRPQSAAPEPRPAPVAAPAAGEQEEPADVEALLASMIAAAQSRPSLAQPLRGASVRIEGDFVHLVVALDFAPFADMHSEEYQELASKALGRKVKVRTSAGPAGKAAAGEPSPTEQKRERLMKEAAAEPAVQEVLDLFNGKVVDVRESKLSS